MCVCVCFSLCCYRYSIVSTGGTASAIEEAGVPVTKVEEITHFSEMVYLVYVHIS